MTKVYLLNQRRNNSSFTLVGKGGNTVFYNFKGGNVINNTLAQFVTDNEYYQHLLEESDMFKKGVVKLDPKCAREMARIKAEQEAEAMRLKASMQQEPDIKTVTEAINYVADHFNEKAATARVALAIAEKNGVTFPNLKVGKK